MKKNIHILETNQPSRLGYISESKTYHLYNNDVFLDELANTINIYITSDKEIEKGVNTWYLDKFLNKPRNSGGAEYAFEQDVIILTTDTTLISDSVQEIDDTFLEWFCQNPTCEFVDILKDKCLDTSLMCDCVDEPCRNKGYKIIIPQEKPKQEPLEEASERILANNIDGLRDALQDDDLFFFYKGVIQCYGEAMVEWKAEALYNEEQVYKILQELRLVFKSGVQKWQEDFEFDLDKWFEQFKKK